MTKQSPAYHIYYALRLVVYLFPWICCPCVSFQAPVLPLYRQNQSQKEKVRTTRPHFSAHADEPLPTPDPTSSSTMNPQQSRTLVRLEKFTRYPVWPAWNGALIWAVSKVLGNKAASELEDAIGGRVCPNFFVNDDDNLQQQQATTSPFLLLVHHCHSFAAWDPLRWFQNAVILPEGFPAHPHRGFVTLTYFLKGGFRHRDSTGVEQFYGVKEDKPPAAEQQQHTEYPHSQWLNTGAGLLHEEMFDFSLPSNPLLPKRHELYQIWINLPQSEKMGTPNICLLSDDTDTPVVQGRNGQVQVRVLAGRYNENNGENPTSSQHVATTPISTEMMILHVSLTGPNTQWTCPIPNNNMETCFLYMRKGSVDCVEGGTKGEEETANTIPPHYTAFFSPTGESLNLKVSSGYNRADFLLLMAQPIREPCVTRGSMVMTTTGEINRAYADYQAGLFGLPWDHKLPREEWLEHVKKFPSRY